MHNYVHIVESLYAPSFELFLAVMWPAGEVDGRPAPQPCLVVP